MKKIMFNDKFGLTQAVLEGRKTMTRRITPKRITELIELASKPLLVPVTAIPDGVSIEEFASQLAGSRPVFIKNEEEVIQPKSEDILKEFSTLFSPYKKGEIIALAQRYEEIRTTFPRLNWYTIEGSAGFHNKMFVDSILMPHWLEIKDVRIERIQEISDEDCIKEGIQSLCTPQGMRYIAGGLEPDEQTKIGILTGYYHLANAFNTPQEAFAKLIDKVSGRNTWEKNPWVMVYEFELVR